MEALSHHLVTSIHELVGELLGESKCTPGRPWGTPKIDFSAAGALPPHPRQGAAAPWTPAAPSQQQKHFRVTGTLPESFILIPESFPFDSGITMLKMMKCSHFPPLLQFWHHEVLV